jgi:hypothetical protein
LANADIALQPGISGSWVVQGDGQGALINVADVNGDTVFVVSWYTYLNGQQVWMIGSTSISDNSTRVTVPVQTANGAEFGAAFLSNDINTINWGTLTFEFSSCDTGTMQYKSDLPEFSSGSLSLTRLTNTKGLVCQNINNDETPPIFSDPITNDLSYCIDDLPQEVCTELDRMADYSANFSFGLSCSILFPEHIYLPDIDPELKNTCSISGFFNCGTCSISDVSTRKSRKSIKTIDINMDIDLIGNIIHEKLLKFDK